MTARRGLTHEPNASVHGSGDYGVRFTRFVESGAPGGYSTVQVVNLFATRKDRDRYAFKLRKEQRGTRRTGPIIETFEVEVADLRWFEPVYRRSVLIEEQGESRYGLVRIYNTNPPVYDVVYAEDEEDLRWMLAAQWNDAERRAPRADEPHAPYDVYFFAPDELPRLFGVVEHDEDEDDE